MTPFGQFKKIKDELRMVGQKANRGIKHLGQKIFGKSPRNFAVGENPRTSEKAFMAAEAYVEPDKRKSNMYGYDYDRTLSNDENAVYHNKKTKHTRHIMRGSAVTRGAKTLAKDLWTDVNIGLGMHPATQRHKQNVGALEATHKKYGKVVECIGHSLGGKSCASATQHAGGGKISHATTFSAGSGLPDALDIYSSLKCKKNPSLAMCRQVHHKVVGDPVAFMPNLTGKTHRYGARTAVETGVLGKAHSIGQFMP